MHSASVTTLANPACTKLEDGRFSTRVSPKSRRARENGRRGLTDVRVDPMGHLARRSSTRATAAPLAQLDRASDFESAGRPFESGGARNAHHPPARAAPA